ncbi:hypothetical protein NE850_27585 [Paraburkholderia sp. USG1]|uniref:hypothetical protein n=1 Tax=Paraburkholderia sp. USG1 TaxID=2952268 RepID=UPI00285535B6|nr:hypothetical protein [Paraburkholderia sp. USG1]MDR8400076.1 hypothetical protein [Paraburkholderia sp. USG1]
MNQKSKTAGEPMAKFVIRALVAAGHVPQTKVDEAFEIAAKTPGVANSAVVLDDERAAFEAWMQHKWEYVDADTVGHKTALEAWLARAAWPNAEITNEQILDLFYADASIDACAATTVIAFARRLLLARAASPHPVAQPVEQISPIIGTQAPFSNCRFKFCDLPGQCRDEGKCHHPAVPAAQPVEQTRALTDDARDAEILRTLIHRTHACDLKFDKAGKVRALHAVFKADSEPGYGMESSVRRYLDAFMQDAAMTAARPASGETEC